MFSRGFRTKPSFATITGKGDNPTWNPNMKVLGSDDFPFQTGDVKVPYRFSRFLNKPSSSVRSLYIWNQGSIVT